VILLKRSHLWHRVQAAWQGHVARYPQPVWVKKALWAWGIKKLTPILLCLSIFFWSLSQDPYRFNAIDFQSTFFGLTLIGPYAIDLFIWPITLGFWLVQCHWWNESRRAKNPLWVHWLILIIEIGPWVVVLGVLLCCLIMRANDPYRS
jgi:hypothetical protein